MSIKFNPFTGNFDFVGNGTGSTSPENFSYKEIASGETVEIPVRQQMLVDGHVRVLGHLSVNGELIDVSNRGSEKFFYTKVNADETVVVEADRLLLYKNHLTVDGHLRVLGTVAGV